MAEHPGTAGHNNTCGKPAKRGQSGQNSLTSSCLFFVFFVFFVVKSYVRQRGRQIAAAQTRKTELKPQMHADAAALHTPT
jgi:hypothetical protein